MDSIDEIIEREGEEFTNRPSDRGGPTKYGITQRTLSKYLKRQATIEDVKNLNRSTARQIYTKLFIEPFNWLPTGKIRKFIEDYAVNSGQDDAIDALQYAAVTKRDGIAGPDTKSKTLNFINLDPDYFFNRLFNHRVHKLFKEAYDSEVAVFLLDHPKSQLHNLKGWIHRIIDFV
jgi:lysozyme family protein